MFYCPHFCYSAGQSQLPETSFQKLRVNLTPMTFRPTWRIVLAAFSLCFSLTLVVAPLTASADSVSQGLQDLKSKTQSSYPANLPGGTQTTLAGTLGTVINYALGIGFAIAIVMVIYGGYQFILSRGNEEQATSGRNTIFYALIGMVVIIFSFVIVNTVVKFAQNGVGGANTANSANNANNSSGDPCLLDPTAPGCPPVH